MTRSVAERLSIFLIKGNNSVTFEKRRVKYAKRVHSTKRFAEWLCQHPQDQQARDWGSDLRTCGDFLIWRQFHTAPGAPIRLAGAVSCKKPLACAFCAARRAAASIGKAVPKVIAALERDAILRPYMLTLTIRNRETVKEAQREFWAAWARLIQDRRNSGKGRHAKSVWADLLGGVLSVETKRGKNSGLWHLHGHAVVLAPRGMVGFGCAFWREQQGDRSYGRGPIAEAWSSVVGYNANCDLRPLKAATVMDVGGELTDSFVRGELGGDLCEVFKYALKAGSLSHEDRWEACTALMRKRLVRSFGCLFNVQEVERYTDDISMYDGLPYLELCWKYLNGEYLDHSVRRQEQHDWEMLCAAPEAY